MIARSTEHVRVKYVILSEAEESGAPQADERRVGRDSSRACSEWRLWRRCSVTRHFSVRGEPVIIPFVVSLSNHSPSSSSSFRAIS